MRVSILAMKRPITHMWEGMEHGESMYQFFYNDCYRYIMTILNRLLLYFLSYLPNNLIDLLNRTINIPWPRKGMTDSDYIYAFNRIVMPIAYEFGPNIVIVSAGFDAARGEETLFGNIVDGQFLKRRMMTLGDPIGENDVTPAGFAHMTSLLKNLAGGKLVLALEVINWLRSIFV